ncbi:MAG: nuclear transport factor 2 family protein [Bacteroidota bacterium]|nr:nuclear transport factor 2 family protein [Bacteroidota bacterium]
MKKSNSLVQNAYYKEQNTGATKEILQPDASSGIIMHHLSSFRDNDLEAVLSDYTNESVLVTQDATYKGPGEIKAFFAELMTHFPKQKSSFELDKMVTNDELVYIIWHANTPSLDVSLGSDTFIVKDGKILRQTFVGLMKFIN